MLEAMLFAVLGLLSILTYIEGLYIFGNGNTKKSILIGYFLILISPISVPCYFIRFWYRDFMRLPWS
jgi:hypothetical protein